NRRGVHTLVDRGKQILFPLQPLHLPGAERQQYGKRDKAQRHGKPEPAPPCLLHGWPACHSLRSSLPCAALLAYCRVSRMPLIQRSDKSPRMSVSGSHSSICTSSVGL